MELLSGALLLASGYYLNNQSKEKSPKLKEKLTDNLTEQKSPTNASSSTSASPTSASSSPKNNAFDLNQIIKAFPLHFFKKKEVSNPNFEDKFLYKNIDSKTMNLMKDSSYRKKSNNLNDVGFESANAEAPNVYENLPSLDDMERDIDMTHNNMVPFFGSTVKQNINDTAVTQHILERYTGNFKDTRRDNKSEVEYLFDPTPNNALVYGADINSAKNRDMSRFFPSNLGKQNNVLPFEQINVGPGVANGYTARPNGGFHQDVRILPKTTEELNVNPKITYEGRVIPGKAVTEKGKVIGQQILKKPKAIMWNWNGERNFTTTGVHKKNKQRPDIILRCTSREQLHSDYTGIAAPTKSSYNTPENLRGKRKVSHKRNFLNTPFRNLIQATGKLMNDLGKSSIWNKPTERSQQSSRVHYTNVHQVQGGRGQQYTNDDLRYTRKQDLIINRPGQSDCVPGSKAGPAFATRGPVYDQDEIAKTTIRETTEDNLHNGFMGTEERRGMAYDEKQWTAKTTIKETVENNNHNGFMQNHERKGKVYDQDDIAKTTIKETTEDNLHNGYVSRHKHVGKVYDAAEPAKVTIKETTEDNKYVTGPNRGTLQGGLGYTVTHVEARLPQKAYLCNNEYVGAGEATTNKKPRSYASEYKVNTNREKIAVGRAPGNSKNAINAGVESVNICIKKIEADQETPYLFGKGTTVGNIYNPKNYHKCTLTTGRNMPPTQVDRLQVDILDQVKLNPLHITQNLN